MPGTLMSSPSLLSVNGHDLLLSMSIVRDRSQPGWPQRPQTHLQADAILLLLGINGYS